MPRSTIIWKINNFCHLLNKKQQAPNAHAGIRTWIVVRGNKRLRGVLPRGQWHQPVRTLKRTGSFLSKKRKIHPWLIFLFFEFEVLYYSHHPCIVTYPLVLKHFCIGGLRLPSIRNFAVGMELIHLPHRL